MSRCILLVENANDFDRLRKYLEGQHAFLSAVPPHLIESSIDPDEPGLRAFKSVRVLSVPVSDADIESLPAGAQLAARAYTTAAPDGLDQREGKAWNAAGYEAPGRPGPYD